MFMFGRCWRMEEIASPYLLSYVEEIICGTAKKKEVKKSLPLLNLGGEYLKQ